MPRSAIMLMIIKAVSEITNDPLKNVSHASGAKKSGGKNEGQCHYVIENKCRKNGIMHLTKHRTGMILGT